MQKHMIWLVSYVQGGRTNACRQIVKLRTAVGCHVRIGIHGELHDALLHLRWRMCPTRNCRCKQILIKEANNVDMHSQDNLAFKTCSRLKLNRWKMYQMINTGSK